MEPPNRAQCGSGKARPARGRKRDSRRHVVFRSGATSGDAGRTRARGHERKGRINNCNRMKTHVDRGRACPVSKSSPV